LVFLRKSSISPNRPLSGDLLNHALRLEYAGVTHLPRLDGAVQQIFARYVISVLSTDSSSHAVKVASTIRELGGAPDWTVWSPPDNATLIRLFEIQLARERICHNLYGKTSALLAGSPLADRCEQLARDEDRHIGMIERVLSAFVEKEGLKQPAFHPVREHAAEVVIVNTASTS
jgi:hypothetical protein